MGEEQPAGQSPLDQQDPTDVEVDVQPEPEQPDEPVPPPPGKPKEGFEPENQYQG